MLPRFASRSLLVLLAACSSRDGTLPPDDAGSTDAGVSADSGRRFVPDTCDAVTGAGCDCPEDRLTRACAPAGGCPGVQECVLDGEFARWSECEAEPAEAESCNGVDDDCDAMVDEGLADETCGVGACERTTPTCVDGAPTLCVPGTPGVEACAGGADDDCDGVVDCDDTDCAAAAECDDCPCRTGTRCAPVGDIICVPAPDYPCATADGWYAICEPTGWACMFTTPPIC